ncbi:nucleotidyl transferase AbiEii/AbiGii toxin family protein [Arundinibacter roseus]|uniref:Nucleotidyl transferase AbiEii/AbiGii toxin family protein n=1 Tax=Arundinibacter roseus TaxID=2070510 RepID=A0A4R4KBT1_9BACT|nr:nucleotidyl transferase AbiEii/AbiGii toxin family protein [Arundinibacter roseus]TDB64222.1 hypothetical protein EZE20_14920 [Arundinibacter roseus]
MNYRNIVRIKVIANALAEINHHVVFVGGAVVDLYCDDPARSESRPTDDIDVVVEIINRGAFANLEEKLRSIGFEPDRDSEVICRYKYHDIVVDIMPTKGEILGFTNPWYEEGVSHTEHIHLENQAPIKIFEVAYFLASKIEALKSERHGKDFRWNSDFEDIIYLFDNRTTILPDLLQSEFSVKKYLKQEIGQLVRRPFIDEEITACLDYSNQTKRKQRIFELWLQFLH